MKEFILPNRSDKIRYHDLPGEGTPIVFLHGLGCASSMDYPAVAAQQPLSGHRRILVDLLGAGFSDKPDDFGYAAEDHADYLLRFIEALELDSFVLFGHSMGGAVAISLARLCEKRIRHLVLTESNLDPTAGSGVLSSRIASQPMEEFLSGGFDALAEQIRQSGSTLWSASFALWSPVAAYRFALSGACGGSIPWRETLVALQCPKTYVFGEHSLPDPDESELRNHGVRVEIVPRAGHGMAWDNPAGLAEAIGRAVFSAP
ncbi:MAG TPA: alpha/beta hydrolase [Feifaniaceae bacterium]|nr:alpha/beta hydrolase [Feifaniaceae bacterium]